LKSFLTLHGLTGIVRSSAVSLTVLALLGHIPTSVAAEGETPVFSADGYRISGFRSPVPDTVPSGVTVNTTQVRVLLEDPDTILIDVLPAPIKPKDSPSNLLWLPPERYNIPGSIWLPNVGYGALSEELDNYFKQNLQRSSASDISRPIILYCLAECWMSWNAAKRAATDYGYSRIYWYPDGTTGWEAAGLPLEKSLPAPMDSP
jgi:PQQ-dependent catabolism-associated CXXCW motif protein